MTPRACLSIMAVLAGCLLAACGDGPDPPPTEYVEPTRPPLPPVGSCIGVLDALGGVAIPCDSEEALYRVLAYQEAGDDTRCPAETTYTAGLAVVPVLSVCYGDPIPGGE